MTNISGTPNYLFGNSIIGFQKEQTHFFFKEVWGIYFFPTSIYMTKISIRIEGNINQVNATMMYDPLNPTIPIQAIWNLIEIRILMSTYNGSLCNLPYATVISHNYTEHSNTTYLELDFTNYDCINVNLDANLIITYGYFNSTSNSNTHIFPLSTLIPMGRIECPESNEIRYSEHLIQ
jgi:hypothetical protein